MTRAYIACLSLASLSACLPLAAQTPAKTTPAAKIWKQTKTPDGQPDIQGVWVNFDSTPFERAAPSPTGAGSAPASGTTPKVGLKPSTPQ